MSMKIDMICRRVYVLFETYFRKVKIIRTNGAPFTGGEKIRSFVSEEKSEVGYKTKQDMGAFG